ncbi:M23 family metallopeptidase [Paraprevotella clara]|uniref:M23 family metallopeptidase n=1 Tax=Paraprevotella clara TaxID=454154 RepID=UPI003FED8C45
MRKRLWVWMAGASCFVLPAHAQFNTVETTADRYKVKVITSDSGRTKAAEGKTVSVQDEIPGDSVPEPSAEAGKKVWIERYLSVSYPLRQVKITSPYGYRKDPFTGKKRFHNGIDLRARGDEVLAMMSGVVVKVGQDKSSGKYVVLQHGSYTISYCHLSRILTEKGAEIRPRDVVGITGSTGRSTGEHLHITCRLDGKSVDPLLVFDYIKAIQEECVAALAVL